MPEAYDLERFVAAQEVNRTYERALGELRRGAKSSHWMWFIFPQLAGLGRSPTSERYALSSLAEARAYLDHPLLGPRLLACAGALLGLEGESAEGALGPVDALKLRSSMTLFARCAPGEPVFTQVLDRYFSGQRDPRTEELL